MLPPAHAFAESHVVAFAALALAAAGHDVSRRRIPNWIVVAIAASGVLAQWAALGVRGAGSAVMSVLLVLVLLTALWMVRAIGGGDAKLGAAAAAWVGVGATPLYLVLTALVGGGIALAYYLAAGVGTQAGIRANLRRLHAPALPRVGDPAAGAVLVPYGAAFVVGALLIVLS